MNDLEVAATPIDIELAASQRMLGVGDGVLQRANLWPVRLVLEVPVVDFTVRTLLALKPGSILETAAGYSEDIVLQVNGQVLGPAKFDVTGQMLAVRLTGVA